MHIRFAVLADITIGLLLLNFTNLVQAIMMVDGASRN